MADTVVNTDGHLEAFTTDELAIAHLLADRQVPPSASFVVCGSGGMARAVVASPAETPLVTRARAAGKPVITGADVAALQAAEQFVLHTRIRPTRDQIEAAAAFARANP